ncbi:MAG: acetolactate synthase large subunit, partial [Clostridiales bacterium]|nr:acetolactate synthase large subunit [Clostridiales bacterium]
EVDIAGITMPVTKHNYIVRDISVLAAVLREAFEVAISGRPGPVLVDIPKDVQLASYEYSPVAKSAPRPDPAVSEREIDAAAAAIRAAKRPYIYCGGGVVISDAGAELAAFAEKIDAPVSSSMMGLSVVDCENPRFLGMMGMHGRYASAKALDECDLLIAVGTRFSDRATGDKAKFSSGRAILHIDIDPAEISKNISVNISVIGNIRQALQRLTDRLENMSHADWMREVNRLCESPLSSIEMGGGALTPQYVIEETNARMAPDELVATDVGQHQMWTTLYYRFKQARTFLTSGGLGAMGFGMGAAIGGCIAKGRKRTILFTSDGSFHMNLSELATAVTNDLPLIVVVLNNGVLGMVRQWQTLFFEGRYSATTLNRKTDYVKLAESFGARGGRAGTRGEFDRCIREAFESRTPYLIDCVIGMDEQVFPMIPPGKGIDDIILSIDPGA